jgi:hypothetical protein
MTPCTVLRHEYRFRNHSCVSLLLLFLFVLVLLLLSLWIGAFRLSIIIARPSLDDCRDQERHTKRHRRLAGFLDPKSVRLKNQHFHVQQLKSTEASTVTSAIATDTQQQQQQQQQRPKMYTFYEPTLNLWNSSFKGTGMTDHADVALLELWVEEWKKMGWDPIILTLNDAKRHARFQEFHQQLQFVPLRGIDGSTTVNTEYNQFCYLRWLAMSTIPIGGYMSDYDVLPIRRFEETIGTFTVYSSGREGRGIPCLMSGSQEEWDRLTWLLLENALHHLDHFNYIDMLALMDLVGEYVPEKTVLEATPLLTGKVWSNEECQRLQGKMAIHVSHYSVMHGVIGEGEGIVDRPAIAKRLLNLFQTTCEYKYI